MKRAVFFCLVLLALGGLGATLPGCGRTGPSASVVRIGHFPNVTHAQALVARQMERRGKPWFEPRLGVRVEWTPVNAGPSAMELLLSGSLDATFVGPNPAINAHSRSKGEEVRIVAGAAVGGSGLVVRKGSGIRSAADLKGKKVATPQLGNTQDVACRTWLLAGGLKVTPTGGDVTVIPLPNPEQLSAFSTGQVDAVWTVEPWLSRLELEGDGEPIVLEENAVTTVLVTSKELLEGRREVARKLVAAHEELTRWITEHPSEAREMVQAELLALTRKEMSKALLDHAWPRLKFSTSITKEPFEKFVADARSVGLLDASPVLDRLVVTP